eukprot:ANDGO_01372.mRNA.1 Glutathione-specific gamma-glutamylcyclotransferase
MLVFGYGSLIFRPSEHLIHTHKFAAFLPKFKRRFWQSDPIHRGNEEFPGLVVTVLETDSEEDKVWGVVYVVPSEHEAAVLEYLRFRERAGYNEQFVSVLCEKHHLDCNLDWTNHLRPSIETCDGVLTQDAPPPLLPSSSSSSSFVTVHNVVFFSAHSNNPHYVGPLELEKEAQIIARAVGESGPNIQYLELLHDAMVRLGVTNKDDYLTQLCRRVRELAQCSHVKNQGENTVDNAIQAQHADAIAVSLPSSPWSNLRPRLPQQL